MFSLILENLWVLFLKTFHLPYFIFLNFNYAYRKFICSHSFWLLACISFCYFVSFLLSSVLCVLFWVILAILNYDISTKEPIEDIIFSILYVTMFLILVFPFETFLIVPITLMKLSNITYRLSFPLHSLTYYPFKKMSSLINIYLV